MQRHAIIICSAQKRTDVDNLTEALNWGRGNLTVRLSSNPARSPVTHYAAATPVSDEFQAMLAAALQGIAPPGVDPALIQVLDLVVFDIEDEGLRSPLEHFDAAIEALGLVRVD